MNYFYTSILLLFSLCSAAQTIDYIPNEIIVQLESNIDGNIFFQKIKKENVLLKNIEIQNVISKRLNLYKISSINSKSDTPTLINEFNQLSEIKLVAQNFFLETRNTTPNDVQYSEQWSLDVIDAPAVWEITTGGVTALGDTIVIAIVEGGDYTHEDLVDNVWINHHEVEDDGIDNDGNGYIDDKYGWNASSLSDTPINRTHSTKVEVILGAKGNNEKGISGVNWDVKVMYVHSSLAFDKIVESYEYIYQTRKLYNDTNGEKGAFVVASNSSFGVPQTWINGDPIFPLWCEMYNTMGEVGVLSAAATDNESFDVNELGDMPSICPSDYLVIVTNNDIADTRFDSAWGKPYVDLSAPGENTFSTWPNNSYGVFRGTSAATPHVTGGIALLYSLPCEQLAKEARENPQATALLMKDFILNGVDGIEAQQSETISGGRLNLKNSMNLISSYCGASPLGILNFDNIFPNPTSSTLNIELTPNQYGDYQVSIFNSIGQLMMNKEININQFGLSKITLDVGHLKTGTYFFVLKNELDAITSKFIVY